MNIPTFFKVLNNKIKKYDKIASNPFEIPQSITIVWVDETITTKDVPPSELQ
jgi:hypothetical protein